MADTGLSKATESQERILSYLMEALELDPLVT